MGLQPKRRRGGKGRENPVEGLFEGRGHRRVRGESHRKFGSVSGQKIFEDGSVEVTEVFEGL